MASDIKPILLVDDSANDIELTLAALEENHLANEVSSSVTVKRRWITCIVAVCFGCAQRETLR
jgi:hypothetical protein